MIRYRTEWAHREHDVAFVARPIRARGTGHDAWAIQQERLDRGPAGGDVMKLNYLSETSAGTIPSTAALGRMMSIFCNSNPFVYETVVDRSLQVTGATLMGTASPSHDSIDRT